MGLHGLAGRCLDILPSRSSDHAGLGTIRCGTPFLCSNAAFIRVSMTSLYSPWPAPPSRLQLHAGLEVHQLLLTRGEVHLGGGGGRIKVVKEREIGIRKEWRAKKRKGVRVNAPYSFQGCFQVMLFWR